MKLEKRIILKKVFISSSVMVAAAFVFVTFWIKIHGDIPAPETSDLNPKLVKLSDKENAYTYFRDAAKSLHRPDNDSYIFSILDGRNWDEDIVNTLLSINLDMFSLLERGLRCTAFQCLWEPLSDDDAPYNKWLSMALIMRLRSMYELKKSQSDAAFASTTSSTI